MSSGERYDFWIEADDPEDLGKYWIKAETLEVAQDGKVEMINLILNAFCFYSKHISVNCI